MADRYLRIRELGWDTNRLQKAKVLVVGAGALGNEVLKNLALLGVGNIWVVDMDHIESHNLTRTVLFRESDIGFSKAEVAAQRIREINPAIQIIPIVRSIQESLGIGFFMEMDVVFGCVDNVQARIDINRYCYQAGVLFIDAGMRKLDGDVKVFGEAYKVCFDCLVTRQMRDEAWRRYSCLKLRSRTDTLSIPTSPTISSIMAGFQVQIAIKYLHQAPIPLDCRISVLGYIDDMHVTKLSPNPNCPTHNMYELINKSELMNLPLRSDTTTVGELLQAVKQNLAQDATIQLDYDLITYFYCPEHDFKLPLIRRRGFIYADEVECPHCKENGMPNAYLLMQEHFINQLNGKEDPEFLQLTLSQIGIPFFHVVCASTFSENALKYQYFILTGDRNG